VTGGTRVPVACRDCQPSSGNALHQLAADLPGDTACAGWTAKAGLRLSPGEIAALDGWMAKAAGTFA